MSLFRASSLCQAVRCPLDLATDGILQLGPVSIPSQHRLRSPEHPPATIAHRLSRELPAQKPSERLYKGTQRWGLGPGGGKDRVNGQAIAICLSSSVFGVFFCFGFFGFIFCLFCNFWGVFVCLLVFSKGGLSGRT